MIICEIGLNHMGDINYAEDYVKKIIKAKADGVIFHIREKEFYDKQKNCVFKLNEEFYFKISKKLKKEKIKLGIAIADPEKISLCEEFKSDFYKIFSRDLLDKKIIDVVRNTKKPIFASTGMSNIKEINKFVNYINKNKKFTLIHTQLNHNIENVNLRAIPFLKEKFGMNVGFGNHSDNHNVLYLSLAYKPDDILFYVKGSKMKKHVDEPHAIELEKLEEIIKNLKILPKSLGKKEKIKMKNSIKSSWK